MKRPNPGFSLTEVLVVVAILDVLSGLVIDAGIRDWRREQVNAVVVELAGWLESVRRAALKGSSCQVTLFDGPGRWRRTGTRS
jgi:prepilin-type N-terminal cleavage/methylation domain-containing protein